MKILVARIIAALFLISFVAFLVFISIGMGMIRAMEMWAFIAAMFSVAAVVSWAIKTLIEHAQGPYEPAPTKPQGLEDLPDFMKQRVHDFYRNFGKPLE